MDFSMVYTADETRDGGQTPGPFEEMRRRMAGLGSESDGEHPGLKKRKRREKKRQWVWTIGTNEDEEEDEKEPLVSTPMAAAKLPQTPITEMEDAGVEKVEAVEAVEETSKIPPLTTVAEVPEIILSGAPPDQNLDTEMMDRPDRSHSE
jgi:hypothetical protein